MATFRGRVPSVFLPVALVVGLSTPAFAATFHYSLPRTGTATGTHWISIPKTLASGTGCVALENAIPNVIELERFDPQTDTFIQCECQFPNPSPTRCFGLVPGTAYRVRVSADSTFEVEGDDGSASVNLLGSSASLTGSNWVSIPFGTPLSTADELAQSLGGYSPSGPVVHVARWLPATDTFQVRRGLTGTNFALAPGVGYLVQLESNLQYAAPSFGGDFCDTPTTCFFDGFPHLALGQATLSLDESGELVWANIGPSGNDGFEIVGPVVPPQPFLGDEEDWIPLGVTTQRGENVGSTGLGSAVTPRATAELAPALLGTAVVIGLDLVEIGGDLIQISSSFGPTGATTLSYDVWDDGAPIPGASTSGQALGSTATANQWPVRQAFSAVQWEENVQISIPGSGAVFSGDELRILPESPTATGIEVIERVQFLVRCGQDQATCDSLPGLKSGIHAETLFLPPAPPGTPLPPLPPLPSFALSTSKSGTGSGTITSSPPGISCGGSCSASFVSGTVVTLTPTPAGGSSFGGWAGDPDCFDGSVVMNSARSCTAVFTALGSTNTLAVARFGTGSGSVTSVPSGINCGSTCQATFATNTVVSLVSNAVAGSYFAGWGGDPDCLDGSVTLSANRSCTAQFTLNPRLTVTKTGAGTGTVSSSPGGISCGAICSAVFSFGTAVGLTATPAAGSALGSFGGDADCSDAQLTMNADRNCVINFVIAPPVPEVLPGLDSTGRMIAFALLALLIALAARRFGVGR